MRFFKEELSRTAHGKIWYDHIVDFPLKAAGRSQMSIAAPGEVAHIGSGGTVAQERLSTGQMEGPNMQIPIETFIDKHTSQKEKTAIDKALGDYRKLTKDLQQIKAREEQLKNGIEFNEFDVVADVIFPPNEPLPILGISDWSTVKDKYVPEPDKMQLILAYRKRYVDRLLREICGKICKKKGWPDYGIVTSSVGSTDLTSDYDITVAIRGNDIYQDDLDVIEQFNNEVRKSFGGQPGTIFDTNLYAEGLLALDVNDHRLSLPEVGKFMYTMLVEGQDEGALCKQRRYMSYEDWLPFLDKLFLSQIPPYLPVWTATRTRYATADAKYLLNLKELLDEFDFRANPEFYVQAAKNAFADVKAKAQAFDAAARTAYANAKAKVDADIAKYVFSLDEQSYVENATKSAKYEAGPTYHSLLHAKDIVDAVTTAGVFSRGEQSYVENATMSAKDEARSKYQGLLRAKARVDAATTAGVFSMDKDSYIEKAGKNAQDEARHQLLLRHKALKWEHECPDLVMWASNDLYISKMRAIRAYQNKFGSSSSAYLEGVQELAKQQKMAEGEVRVADLISEAIFFANEAYLSEGPLRHVVQGVQAARANSKKESPEVVAEKIRTALLDLTVEQLLQSINEQFGDFLKDFAHYKDTPEFLFRGAKYLQRLFEAADILSVMKKSGLISERILLTYLDFSKINERFPKNMTAEKILDRLNTETEGLLAVRKGKKKDIDTVDLRDTYCKKEVKDYFGADTGTDLTNCIREMVLLLNAQVRRGLIKTPTVDDVRAYFAAIGANG